VTVFALHDNVNFSWKEEARSQCRIIRALNASLGATDQKCFFIWSTSRFMNGTKKIMKKLAEKHEKFLFVVAKTFFLQIFIRG
jgi:hypothetical protein